MNATQAQIQGLGELQFSIAALNQEAVIQEQEVVTATKIAQTLKEAPATITVITAEEIKQRGYSSLSDVLQGVAGIYQLTDHTNVNLGVRGVNGGLRANSRIIKLMINGQQVAFRPYNANFLTESLIPIQMIKRVEVLRGASSALFGANAYLGVINVITHQPRDYREAQTGEVRLGGNKLGDNYGEEYSLYLTRQLTTKTAVSVAFNNTVQRFDGLEVQNLPDRITPLYSGKTKDAYRLGRSFYTEVNHRFDNNALFSFDASVQHHEGNAGFKDWGVLEEGNYLNYAHFYARGRYERNFGKNTVWKSSVTWAAGSPADAERLTLNQRDFGDWVERKVNFNALDFSTYLNTDFKAGNLTAGVDYTTDKQQLLVFERYFQDGENIGMAAYDPLGAKRFNNIGVYLQGIYYPFHDTLDNRRLYMMTGIRYDHHNIYGDVLNYRLAAVYRLYRQLYVKAIYGTSFMAPAPTQLYRVSLPADVIGNEELKPERARTMELALNGEISQGITLSANIYYTRVDDKVELVRQDAASLNVIPVNKATIHSKGIELGGRYSYKSFWTYGNMSYQHSTYDKYMHFVGNYKEHTRLYPGWMTKAGVGYALSQYKVAATLEGQWIGERLSSEQNIVLNDAVNENPYALGAYTLMNLYLSTHNLKFIHGKELRIGFKVNNLLNTSYAFPGFKGYDIPGFGRNYQLTIAHAI
ncbi:hypothetical protein GCM10023331_40590 [Algivirga pacifica]|uniref:TonB-dependent receptor n=1 Tax=Algivirga pacifica TaxID=1162670 RepID=A0ABP9DPT0_9BACT